MAKTTRLIKSFSRLILPVILLVILAVAGASVWLTYTIAHPRTAKYLVTPEQYGQLSARGAQVTEETWTNRDGTASRGWLLRGSQDAPAVVLFHKFGADRSYVLNLGVKLSESTNFTVLMPDLRAHGDNPSVKNSSFGGCEGEDALAAIAFVRDLKNENQISLVGQEIGVYGVELGSLIAVAAASKDPTIKAIVLDSVPGSSNDVLAQGVGNRFPFASNITSKFAGIGSYFYYFDGCYGRNSTCDLARKIEGRNILLMAGIDAERYQDPSSKLAKCFPSSNNIETKLELSPSGFSIINASMDQSELYDQRVIDFFRNGLGH